jgi:hypothetical protein
VWSYNTFGAGYYYINSNYSAYYYLSAFSHTDFTNQVITIDPTSCAGTTTTTTTTLAPTTTTTTTTAAPSFYYNNAYRNTCGGANPCTDDGVEVVLRSTTPLNNGSWYSDGTKSYQPYGGTSGPSYDVDVDSIIYTEASSCETACNNV